LTEPETEGLADGKQNFPDQSPAFESIYNDSNKCESLLSLLQWENCLVTPESYKHCSIQSSPKSSSFVNTMTISGVPKDQPVKKSSTLLNNIEYYPYEPGEAGQGVSLFPVLVEDVLSDEQIAENSRNSFGLSDEKARFIRARGEPLE